MSDPGQCMQGECVHPVARRDLASSGAEPTQNGCECDYNAGNWYALYTRHQHEKAVADHLDRLGFEVFLPLHHETRQWNDRRKKVSVPLFPCYVFFSGDLTRKFQILNMPGVCSLVASGGKAATIPPAELAAVRRLVESPLPVAPHPFLQHGDRVRVVSGPLVGIEGIVARRKDSLRVVLSVEMLRQSVAVEVDEALLEFAACV